MPNLLFCVDEEKLGNWRTNFGVLFDRMLNAEDGEKHRLLVDLVRSDLPFAWRPCELSPCMLRLKLSKPPMAVVPNAEAPSTEIESEGRMTLEVALLLRPGR